jgi:hypothetical protein
LGRNHAGRPRHRLVRAEGTRLGLAGAVAWQPDAPAAVPDERGDVRGRPQDHTPALDGEEGVAKTKDHREALDRPAQGDREAFDREAFDDQARGSQDHAARFHRTPHDGEANHQTQLDPQEAPLAASDG